MAITILTNENVTGYTSASLVNLTEINIGTGNTISHNNSHIIGKDDFSTDAANTLYTNNISAAIVSATTIILGNGIVIEGESIKSKAEAEEGGWSNSYINLYDGAIDLCVGDTNVCLTSTEIDLMTRESLLYMRSDHFGIMINNREICRLQSSNITAGRIWELPNADGTIALTSDIPSNGIEVAGYTTDATKKSLSCTGTEELIIIPNNTVRNFSYKGIGVGNEGLKDTYTGTPDGCSTPVTISFVYPGAHTPTKSIGGDGVKNINTLISEYNIYVARGELGLIISLTSGDGTQIIADRTNIKLTGGTDVWNCATYNVIGTVKNIGGTVTVENVTASEITDEMTVTGLSAEADDTNNALVITATGKANTTIYWSAKVEWHDITFA